MRAAIYTRYGPPDVFQIIDVEEPPPKDEEVLIKHQERRPGALDRRG